MTRFLANENVPGEVVNALRLAGYDVGWIAETSPSLDDETVLANALSEGKVLLTFDKDFGEMAFYRGRTATCGIILFRPRTQSPDYLARFVLSVLAQTDDWTGKFSVAQEGKLRVVQLP